MTRNPEAGNFIICSILRYSRFPDNQMNRTIPLLALLQRNGADTTRQAMATIACRVDSSESSANLPLHC